MTLSQGDLHAEPLDFGKNIDNEISQLSESTNQITTQINAIITDLDNMLAALGNGALTYSPADVYIGDFAKLRASYERIIDVYKRQVYVPSLVTSAVPDVHSVTAPELGSSK